MKVNQPASAFNGEFRLYANGDLIQKRDRIQFRKADGAASEINKVLFHTFHGGNAPEWAPKNSDGSYATLYAYFDNIAVYDVEHVRLKPKLEFWPASVRFEPRRNPARSDMSLRIFSLDGRALGSYSIGRKGGPAWNGPARAAGVWFELPN